MASAPSRLGCMAVARIVAALIPIAGGRATAMDGMCSDFQCGCLQAKLAPKVA